jgi:membrane fusion protein, heavy metal efflux system
VRVGRSFLFLYLLVFSWTLTGCQSKVHKDHGHAHELPSLSVTERTSKTELFMENRAFVKGRETSFAVHLTDLNGFKPVIEGKVTLIFRSASGQEDRFVGDGPTSPGIFRPIARLKETGNFSLILKLEGPQVEDEYDLGQVTVYSSEDEAAHAIPAEEESSGISFLKEQQWKVEFMIEEVKERELVSSVKTYGQVLAPSSAMVLVTAPSAGKFVSALSGPALFRAFVEKGQKLGAIVAEGKEQEIVAPVSGIATKTTATDEVQAGAKIFEIADLSTVWIEASLYEPDIEKAGDATEAVIEIPGTDKRFPTKRLLAEGGIFNASSRTLPVLFEIDNTGNLFRVGSAVTVYIRTKDHFKGASIPKEALIDESGQYFVYLQKEGESFERRQVKPVVWDGNWIGVEGLSDGEFVVTKGAYLVRLASSSSQVPAHGHAH